MKMKQVFTLLLGSTLFFSCEKFSFTIENLNNDGIQVLGHGGMGVHSLLPMNSLASVTNCIEKGAVGTELDVQLSKDGKLVAFHDTDLSESTSSCGLINNYTWEELKEVRYTDYSINTNYPLMLVEEIIAGLSDREDLIFSFDCKLYTDTVDQGDYYTDFTAALIQLIEGFDLDCFIESQDSDFLKIIQEERPYYKLLFYPSTFVDGFARSIENDFYGMSISTDAISATELELAHDNGLWVSLWNVRTRARNKAAILKNPDCIQADKLDHLINLLD